MSKVPTQLFINSNMNQINQINSIIIQNEEESFMTKLKNFKNSCPLIIKSIIIFNIINLFINLFLHLKGIFFLIIRTFFIFFFWAPLGKQIEFTSGSGRYLLLFLINNFIIMIPYFPIFNNLHLISEINFSFALFETLLVAFSNKDKHIVVINKKIPFKYIIYIGPFISFILVYRTYGIVFTVLYSFLYHKYLINKLYLSDEIIKKFENLNIIKILMNNRSYIKKFDEYIPIVENNIQDNENIYDNNVVNIQNQDTVFENINDNSIYYNQNNQFDNNIPINQCNNDVQKNIINDKNLNMDNKEEVIDINECQNLENKNENIEKKNNISESQDLKNDKMNIENKNEENSESFNEHNNQNNIENKKEEEAFEYFNLKNKPNGPILDSNGEEIFEYFNLKNKPNEPKLDSNGEEIFEYFNLKNKPNEPKLDSNGEEIFEYFNLKKLSSLKN